MTEGLAHVVFFLNTCLHALLTFARMKLQVIDIDITKGHCFNQILRTAKMFSLKYETCGLIGCKGVIECNMLLSQAPMVDVVKQVFWRFMFHLRVLGGHEFMLVIDT